MIELPEARTLADQLNKTVKGKWIAEVVAVQSPHKLTWYHGDPQEYPKLLAGKRISQAEAYGGLVEIEIAWAEASTTAPAAKGSSINLTITIMHFE